MTSTLHDDDLDAALRAHDVASPALAPAQQARKDELLASLLTTEPHGLTTAPLTPAQRTVVARRRRRRAARWAVPLVAAAAAASVVTLPGNRVTSGSSSGTAFASWTARPVPVDAATRAAAEHACRASAAEDVERLTRDAPEQAPTLDPATLRGVLAERRGGAVLVAMAAADGSTSVCYFHADDPTAVVMAGGGLATADSAPPVPLRPDQVDVGGAGSNQEGDVVVAHVVGRVGPGVRAVTIHSAGTTVTATVANGYLAAWWPIRERPANAPAPRETFDVTLADGRVVHGAENVFHAGETPVGPRQVGRLSEGGGSGTTTLGGEVGAEVTAVVVHVGSQTVEAPLVDQVFAVELPEGTDTAQARFDLTLRDGTVLRDQAPAGH